MSNCLHLQVKCTCECMYMYAHTGYMWKIILIITSMKPFVWKCFELRFRVNCSTKLQYMFMYMYWNTSLEICSEWEEHFFCTVKAEGVIGSGDEVLWKEYYSINQTRSIPLRQKSAHRVFCGNSAIRFLRQFSRETLAVNRKLNWFCKNAT